MNMQILSKSRKKPRTGDIFAYRILDRDFRFGRVINDEGKAGPGSLLVYFYKAGSPTMETLPEIDNFDFLVPPMFVMAWQWQDGYFKTVERRPLPQNIVLPAHCFQRGLKKYVDENGLPISARFEPCGAWGIALPGSVDTQLSQAVGVAQHPDTIVRPEDFAPGKQPGLAGLVYLNLAGVEHGKDALQACCEIEDVLADAVEVGTDGFIDGHETRDGFMLTFIYGRNTAKLRAIVLETLASVPVPSGSYAVFGTGKRGKKVWLTP